MPISVSAFSADTLDLQGIVDIEDTYGAVPGLYFTGNFLSPNRDFRQLVIRGVGANSQLEPSVATFVDGVYSPSLAFDLDFLDLERVEILKGPQGSLFGRNTEGGALNIVTRKPDEEFRGKVSVMADEFNTFQIAGSVSGAISEENNLYGKIAVLHNQTDGFIDNRGSVATSSADILQNVTNVPIPETFEHSSKASSKQDEGDKQAITGGLRWLPNDALEVVINFDHSQYEGGDQAPGPLADCGECYEVTADNLFDQESESSGVSLTVNWDLGGMELTSVTGWRDMEASVPWDFDGVTEVDGSPRINNVHDFDSEQSIVSQEIRLASTGEGQVSWLVGMYFFEEENNSDRFYNFPNLDDPGGADPQQFLDGLWNQQIVNIDRTGSAFFGQVTYNVTEQLELAAGMRYSDEEAEVEALERYCFPFAGFNSAAGDGSAGPTGGLDTFCSIDQGDWVDFDTFVEDDESWDNISTSLSARYRFGEDLMAYFSYSEGFKAGSYQKAPVAVADVVPIDPEELESFEVGFKGTFFDQRLSLETAIYMLEITDQQLQGVVVRNGITASAIGNAAESEVQGLEMSLDARLTDNLKLMVDYGYVDSEFKDYVIDPGTGPVDRSGDEFPNTPKNTVSVALQHLYQVNDEWDLTTYLSYRYVDEIYVGSNAAAVDPIIDVPDWKQVDLRFSLASEDWAVTLFAENLTDEYIVLARWNPFFVEPNLGVVHDRVAPPRRVGVSLTRNF